MVVLGRNGSFSFRNKMLFLIRSKLLVLRKRFSSKKEKVVFSRTSD